ncbi:MAG: DUF1577 domain-containing protein [Spirochaetia bacterium]|nr:DUF1577 domain-containing protein [Spirochaetia bacterium]
MSAEKEEKNSEQDNYEKVEVIREDARENSIVNEQAKIAYLIKEYILGKPLYIKHTIPSVEVSLEPVGKDNQYTLILKRPYTPGAEVSVYLTYKRHMELSCTVLKTEGSEYIVSIKEAIISNKPRAEKRLGVAEHEVFGHHFYISKNKIDFNPMSFSVSNKVLFKDAERTLSPLYPFIKIFDMDPQNDTPEKKIIKKFGKGVFITSLTIDSETEFTEELGTMSAKEALGDNYKSFKTDLVNKGVQSWLIRPILYTNIKGEIFPIGYMLLKSSDKILGLEDYQKLEAEETKIVERIKDSNTIILNNRQIILNISPSGALLEVEDKEFQGYLLQRTDMTFDLLFKYMAGLRFYARIHHIRKKSNGNLLIGLGFHGIVYTGGISGTKSRKMLEESLTHLIKQGASYTS